MTPGELKQEVRDRCRKQIVSMYEIFKEQLKIKENKNNSIFNIDLLLILCNYL